MIAIWIATLALAAPPLTASAARVGENTELTVGEPFAIEVVARHAPGGVALLPEALELPAALGERSRARRHARRLEGEVELDVYTLELLPFEAGLIEIPPLELALGATVAATDSFLVEVRSTLSAEELESVSSTRPETLGTLEAMAAGDPPPAVFLVPNNLLLLAGAGLVGLILVVVAARALLRSRAQKPQVVPMPPPRPAHEVVLERLQALERADYVSKGAFNLFYTELSFALRAYLGSRYGFDALERTVDELLEHVQTLSTPGLDRSALQGLLFEAEQIKFAKYRPRAEAATEALRTARTLVDRSRVGAEPRPAEGPRPHPAAEGLIDGENPEERP